VNRALALLALGLVVVLAHFVRVRAGAEHTLAGSDAAELGTHWLVDDARTASHLRRIELAIAADRLPLLDRWLEHSHGAEVPALPLFDLSLAAIAERFAGGSRAAGASPEEADIEDVVLAIPPWIGALTAVLVAWAVRGFVAGRSAWIAALVAGIACAVAPAAVRAGAAGQLDSAAWVALLAALQIGLAARALRAEEPLDAILGALVCGLVGGLALASSMAGGVALFAGVWIGCVVRALVAQPEERALALRAGLCYCAVAAFVVQLPLLGESTPASGPWLVSTWCSGVSQAALYAATPFLLGVVLRSRARAFQTAAVVVGLGLLVYFAPETFRKLNSTVRAVAAWRATSSLFAQPDEASTWGSALASLTPVALLFPFAIGVLGRDSRRPECAMLVAISLLSFALACIAPRQLAVFVVPMMCSLALLAVHGLESSSVRIKAAARVVCGAGVFVLVIAAVRASRVRVDLDSHDARRDSHGMRLEWVSGLRWMRAHTPSAGAFNAPTIPGEYAVLCTPEIASLVVYHARRPTLASTEALPRGESNLPEVARTLIDSDEERMIRVMHAAGARYVVTGPRSAREFTALESTMEAVPRSALQPVRDTSLLWRLAMTPDSKDAARIVGITRVYASLVRIGVDGRARSRNESTRPSNESTGPAISIWRLDAPRPPPAPARLTPR
jgi:hypothetical protein